MNADAARTSTPRIKDTLRLRIASGALWALSGAVSSRAVVLCANILAARLLGKLVFGEFAVVQTTATTFGIFVGIGVGVTATKHIAEFRSTDRAAAGRALAITEVVAGCVAGILAIPLIVAAKPIAVHILVDERLTRPLQLAVPLLIGSAWFGALSGGLAGLERFREIAIVNLASALASLPMILVGARYFGVGGAILGNGLGSLVGCALGQILLRRAAAAAGIPLRLDSFRRELPRLLHFALPTTMSSSLVGPVQWFCIALLAHATANYSEVAIYTAANQWFVAAMFVPALIGQVVLPILSERVAQRDAFGVKRLLAAVTGVNAIVVLPVAAIASLFGRDLMALFGRDFTVGASTVTLVILTAALLALQACVGQLLIATGRVWIGFFMNAGWATIYIGASLLLVSKGAWGLAAARLIAYAAHFLWTTTYAIRYLKRKITGAA